MVHVQSILALVSVAALLPLRMSAGEVDNKPVSSFDLPRYLGTWYEIARFDHSFERGLSGAVAEYTLKTDGNVDVLNSGWKSGKHKTAQGKAKQPDPVGNPALLRVSFFLFFYSDYRVLMIDKDYSVALVGSSSDKYLWILSRTQVLPQKTLDGVLIEARRRGYDTSKLIFVDQSSRMKTSK